MYIDICITKMKNFHFIYATYIGNGSIDFEEFVLMMAKKLEKTNTEDEIREAFKLFDKDDNGCITVTELRNILTETGQKIRPEEADELMKAIDTDGDGKIDYEGTRCYMLYSRTCIRFKFSIVKHLHNMHTRSSREVGIKITS